MNNSDKKTAVLCIGGGPAGLTASYLLAKKNVPVTIVEADTRYLGGIAKTVSYKGFFWDIGGHRFFSKSEEVMTLWKEILEDDFIKRRRKSRIYYRKKFFNYPLKPWNALLGLGFFESCQCLLSYFYARCFPIKNPTNFEEWVRNKFGRRLFSVFFKSYTEKVWGMKCSSISADWAAERINELSLWPAIKNALFPSSSSQRVIKTLIDSFHYPRYGPGMMWERAGEKIIEWGGNIVMGHRTVGLALEKEGWRVTSQGINGEKILHHADCVVSSAPLGEIMLSITPRPPEELLLAAKSLKYRDFLVVGLMVKGEDVFDDNWIYIHDPTMRVGRIQNMKSWSPEMVPQEGKNGYGMEYFCFEGDGLWNSSDDTLVALASRELTTLGLAKEEDIVDGVVIRQKKAYPVYDQDYAKIVGQIRLWVEEYCPGLHLVGRNGMHQYNNQDHAMMTAMLTVENILAGEDKFDVWQVDQDAGYQRGVPRPI